MKKIRNINIRTKLITATVLVMLCMLAQVNYSAITVNKLVTSEESTAALRVYIISAVSWTIFTALLLFLFVFYVANRLRKGMAQLTVVTTALANGNTHGITIDDRTQDEIGKVLTLCRVMVSHIEEQANIAQEVAKGNLSLNLDYISADDTLGFALGTMIDQNLTTLSNIKHAAAQVSTSSSEVANASEALAQGSTEQASAIEEITASISDVAGKTKENATEANEAADLVEAALANVRKGNVQMADMMSAMKAINESSENISKIIKVIDDIAFQTNILALNAAVEAARAGDAGKGFAVVAEEVRNLAAKSASAAAETAELIEDSIHKVNSGSEIAADTAKALEEITIAVEKSEVIIRDISEASNYQATAIAQINQAVGQVSQVVQNNSATSEECAAASIELSNQANRMQEFLAVYQLGDGASTDAYAASSAMPSLDFAPASADEFNLDGDFGKY